MEIEGFQLAAFEEDGWRRFEEEMVQHITNFSPVLTSPLGGQQILAIVRTAIHRSEAYGFTRRGPIRLFLELVFLCGGAFDTDPQFARIAAPLREFDDQMVRAQRMHEEHSAFLKQVEGTGSIDVQNAFEQLQRLSQTDLPVALQSLDEDLLRELRRISPQKTAYAGERAMRMLLEEAKTASSQFDFTSARELTLMIALMFAFGHGCIGDSLYPWIGSTLRDERVGSAAGRATRLESKASTWLEHVLTNTGSGTGA